MKKVVVVVGPREQITFEGNELKVTNTKDVLVVRELTVEATELGVFKVWRYWYEVVREGSSDKGLLSIKEGFTLKKNLEVYRECLQKVFKDLGRDWDPAILDFSIKMLKDSIEEAALREFAEECKKYNAPKSINTPEALDAFKTGLKLAEERRKKSLP